jgi:hypothetical protein
VFGGQRDTQGDALDEIVRFNPALDATYGQSPIGAPNAMSVVGHLTPPGSSTSFARSGTSAVFDGTLHPAGPQCRFGCAYIFGGSANTPLPDTPLRITNFSDILQYDPTTNTTTKLPVSLPKSLSGTSAVWVPDRATSGACTAGCAYIFGGGTINAGLTEMVPNDEVYRFDPAADVADRVKAVGAVAVGRWGGDAVCRTGKVDFLGGAPKIWSTVFGTTDELAQFTSTPIVPATLDLPAVFRIVTDDSAAEQLGAAVGSLALSWLSPGCASLASNVAKFVVQTVTSSGSTTTTELAGVTPYYVTRLNLPPPPCGTTTYQVQALNNNDQVVGTSPQQSFTKVCP